MSRRLNDLSPEFRPLVVEFLARLCEEGIPILITDTLRTPEEQEENIRRGVSWTKNSRHLTGHAIDVVPYDVYQLTGPDKLQWSTDSTVWAKIGKIGEECGLVWGGRWTKTPDYCHFEMKNVPVPGTGMARESK